jgi:hypothetical protein
MRGNLCLSSHVAPFPAPQGMSQKLFGNAVNFMRRPKAAPCLIQRIKAVGSSGY